MPKTPTILRLLQEKTKAEVYLVGGFVRDFLRKKPNEDLDVVVRKITEKAIIAFLGRYGTATRVAVSPTNDSFTVNIIVFRANGDSKWAQISLPKAGRNHTKHRYNSLRSDALCRDFTINAMYLPINFKSSKDIIDFFDGRKDIAEKRIKSIRKAEDCIKASPVRILRAFSLAARTGYQIDAELIKAIRENPYFINRVPVENIRKEVNTILLSNKPSKFLRLMHNTNVLSYTIPELERCVGVLQDYRYHKFDVFTHCCYTCDNIEPTLVLRLAALFHDVGKPDTRAEVVQNGEIKITFHKHEIASIKRTKAFLDRLKYDNETKEAVLKLIELHMYHYTREYTDTAVRRFVRKTGIKEDNLKDLKEFPLFKLRAAERLGNGLKKEPITQKQLDFENRIREVVARGASLEIKDLEVNGHILMEAFGLKPGKKVGDILNHLLEIVQEDKTLNNRLDLMQLAINYFKTKTN